MALQLYQNYKNLIAENCYIRIHTIEFAYPGKLQVVLRYYADQSTATADIDNHFRQVVLNLTDFVESDTVGARTSIYNWLKTLPEYAGALDVLE